MPFVRKSQCGRLQRSGLNTLASRALLWYTQCYTYLHSRPAGNLVRNSIDFHRNHGRRAKRRPFVEQRHIAQFSTQAKYRQSVHMYYMYFTGATRPWLNKSLELNFKQHLSKSTVEMVNALLRETTYGPHKFCWATAAIAPIVQQMCFVLSRGVQQYTRPPGLTRDLRCLMGSTFSLLVRTAKRRKPLRETKDNEYNSCRALLSC